MAGKLPDLTALLGSRICHDLISPLGAVSNGLELLEMVGGSSGPEISLISTSVANANARIRFFRIAFGTASSDQNVSAVEVRSILHDTTLGSRFKVDWQVTEDAPRREVKLAFLAIQCMESALAFGGRVTVRCSDTRWHIDGEAVKLKAEPALWTGLQHGEIDVTPAQVQFALLPAELKRQGRTLALDIQEQTIAMNY